MNTKLVLWGTVVLLVVGTIYLTLIEWDNPATLGGLDPATRVLAGFFLSVQTRTARLQLDRHGGDASRVAGSAMDVLMFIGAGPAGTAGGIKVTTFAVLFFILLAELRGEGAVNIFGKRLSRAVHRQAITVVLIAVAAVMAARLLMLVTELDARPHPLRGDLGVQHQSASRPGITRDLPAAASSCSSSLMFLGRLGPLTLGSAIALRERRILYEYPEGKARHWLDSRSSVATPRAASPRRTRWRSSGSDGSAARSRSSSWPVAPRCSASTWTKTLVQALNGQLTQVVRADSTKDEVLRQLAIDEFDRVVVAIGDDISGVDPHLLGAPGDEDPGHLGEGRRRPARARSSSSSACTT